MKNTQFLKAEKILEKVKKAALTGTAMAMLSGVLLTGGGTQAYASDLEEIQATPISEAVEVTEEAKEETVAKSIFSLFSFMTNNDVDRRAALEEAFDIELNDELDIWVDKYQEDPTYTSHDVLKKLNSYGLNASRQELIWFGIRTGDWQPYDALSAMERPAFYEFIDGQFVKNKFYYGWLIESQIRNNNWLQTEIAVNKDSVQDPAIDEDTEVEEVPKTYLEILVEDYKNAPGVIPHVVGFNSDPFSAKEFGVEQPPLEFYNSKWNHPDVMAYGNFSEEERRKQAEKEMEALKAAEEKAAEEADETAEESTPETNDTEEVEEPAV